MYFFLYLIIFIPGSPQRRLSYEVVNWLKQLYAINPYPDRFQIGAMALHCKTESSRVQVKYLIP
jgi:hypothetical protein